MAFGDPSHAEADALVVRIFSGVHVAVGPFKSRGPMLLVVPPAALEREVAISVNKRKR